MDRKQKGSPAHITRNSCLHWLKSNLQGHTIIYWSINVEDIQSANYKHQIDSRKGQVGRRELVTSHKSQHPYLNTELSLQIFVQIQA